MHIEFVFSIRDIDVVNARIDGVSLFKEDEFN